MNLLVDGIDENRFRDMLEIDLMFECECLFEVSRVYEVMGGYSLIIGILGVVLGLI